MTISYKSLYFVTPEPRVGAFVYRNVGKVYWYTVYVYILYELNRMLISKNVNNDVTMNPPISEPVTSAEPRFNENKHPTRT